MANKINRAVQDKINSYTEKELLRYAHNLPAQAVLIFDKKYIELDVDIYSASVYTYTQEDDDINKAIFEERDMRVGDKMITFSTIGNGNWHRIDMAFVGDEIQYNDDIVEVSYIDIEEEGLIQVKYSQGHTEDIIVIASKKKMLSDFLVRLNEKPFEDIRQTQSASAKAPEQAPTKNVKAPSEKGVKKVEPNKILGLHKKEKKPPPPPPPPEEIHLAIALRKNVTDEYKNTFINLKEVEGELRGYKYLPVKAEFSKKKFMPITNKEQYCIINDMVDYFDHDEGITKYGTITKLGQEEVEEDGAIITPNAKWQDTAPVLVRKRDIIRIHNPQDWVNPICKSATFILSLLPPSEKINHFYELRDIYYQENKWYFVDFLFPKLVKQFFYGFTEQGDGSKIEEGVCYFGFTRTDISEEQFDGTMELDEKVLKYILLAMKNNPNYFKPNGYEYYYYDKLNGLLKTALSSKYIGLDDVKTNHDYELFIPLSDNELYISDSDLDHPHSILVDTDKIKIINEAKISAFIQLTNLIEIINAKEYTPFKSDTYYFEEDNKNKNPVIRDIVNKMKTFVSSI